MGIWFILIGAGNFKGERGGGKDLEDFYCDYFKGTREGLNIMAG